MPAPEDLATASTPADTRHLAAAAGWPSPRAAWVAVAALVFGLGWGHHPRARLNATLASESAAPDRLLLGRNRQGNASFPLWSSTFSELWLTAAIR